jgi:hypothetical protein
VEKSHVSSDHFVSFLHQNCLDFCADCDGAVLLTGYLSDADCLTHWSIRPVLEPHRTSIACRGILFSNNDSQSTHQPGWKPLQKAQLNSVNKQLSENCFSLQHTFRRYRLSSVELHTQLLPYLAIMGRWNGSTEAESHLVRTVGRFPVRNFEPRKRNLSESDAIAGDDDNCDFVSDIVQSHWTNMGTSNEQSLAAAAAALPDNEPNDGCDEEIIIEDSDG